MSPNLATHEEHARTGDDPLITPVPSGCGEPVVIDVRSLAEWAVAELGAVPTEPGHCHICGMLPGVLHRTEATEDAMHHGARRPQTLADIHGDAIHAALAVFGVSGIRPARWEPETIAAVRRLARDLDASAWCADNP